MRCSVERSGTRGLHLLLGTTLERAERHQPQSKHWRAVPPEDAKRNDGTMTAFRSTPLPRGEWTERCDVCGGNTTPATRPLDLGRPSTFRDVCHLNSFNS